VVRSGGNQIGGAAVTHTIHRAVIQRLRSSAKDCANLHIAILCIARIAEDRMAPVVDLDGDRQSTSRGRAQIGGGVVVV
jgi:hypothetical protein